MRFRHYTLLLLVTVATVLQGQDEHFSQFFAVPMHLNPALTGAYSGKYRMAAIYRDQWDNQLESPYTTFAAGGDTNIEIKVGRGKDPDRVGIGLFFVNDKVAEFQTVNNKISANFSYQKRLGKKRASYLGAGVQFGITQRNINYDNITFQDQFNQLDGFTLPTAEFLPPNNFGAFDLGVGINYSAELNKSDFHLGVAIHHVNEPSYSFFDQLDLPNPSIDLSQKLESRLVTHLSYNTQLRHLLQLQPRVIYQQQGQSNQLDLGSNIEFGFKDRPSAFILGFWLTTLDDIDGMHLENVTPLVGLKQGQFIFGLSYDIHLRDVLTSPFGFNTFEFSVRFSGSYEEGGAYCPSF